MTEWADHMDWYGAAILISPVAAWTTYSIGEAISEQHYQVHSTERPNRLGKTLKRRSLAACVSSGLCPVIHCTGGRSIIRAALAVCRQARCHPRTPIKSTPPPRRHKRVRDALAEVLQGKSRTFLTCSFLSIATIMSSQYYGVVDVPLIDPSYSLSWSRPDQNMSYILRSATCSHER